MFLEPLSGKIYAFTFLTGAIIQNKTRCDARIEYIIIDAPLIYSVSKRDRQSVSLLRIEYDDLFWSSILPCAVFQFPTHPFRLLDCIKDIVLGRRLPLNSALAFHGGVP